jgi:hypothetical protein
LKSQLGLKKDLRIEEKTIFTEYGTEYKPSKLICDELTPEQKEKGLSIINYFNKPMDYNLIIDGLSKIKYKTISKNNGDVDEEVKICLYAEELSKYPADIANKALTSRFKFFPALSELIEICEGEVLRRKIIKRKFEL